MLGVIILLVLLSTEVGFMIYCLTTRSYQGNKKNIIRIAVFALLIFLGIIGVIHMSFRWYMLYLILFIKAILAIWYFVGKSKRKEKILKKKYVIIICIGNALLFIIALIPAIMFPQFNPIEITGESKTTTVSYTLTDPDRIESFSDKKENRQVTIQFWYPENVNEKYPLVIFSHGSFGFRGSNASTYENLASNGYVVCSIDHTYYSFFTKQTDGKTVIGNMDFVNNAMAIENNKYDAQTTYEMTQEWMNIRKGDFNLVLKEIMKNIESSGADEVYPKINPDKIGLFGHSIGGAVAAQLGRERMDVDAVIVVDGTMLGEEIGFKEGKAILNSDPYPVPILNIYNEEHYKDALKYAQTYANMVVTAKAVDASQVVVKGSGHLNFTDLPMFSPYLASMLGTGEVDSRYCIETMNQIVLEYFNYYLKDVKELNLQGEY